MTVCVKEVLNFLSQEIWEMKINLNIFLRYCSCCLRFEWWHATLNLDHENIYGNDDVLYLLTSIEWLCAATDYGCTSLFRIKRMKKRSLNGLITGCSVIPLAIMVAVVHFKSILAAFNTGYDKYVDPQMDFLIDSGIADNHEHSCIYYVGSRYCHCLFRYST